MTVESPTPEELREKALREFYFNRRLAHEVIFRRRHPIRTPAFHHVIQDAFHGPHPQVIVEGFRDAAKSTVAEEAFVLGACFQEFKFGVILGASLPRAKERLAAVKNEFTVNEAINQLFGNLQGETWQEQKIVLSNGVCIMAAGAGQSMRGMRHLDDRPDFGLIDDLEDEESVRTPEARAAMLAWLYRTFIPALKKGDAGQLAYRLRFMGNRLDSDAVIVQIAKDAAWKHLKFPIMEQAGDGVERFDLPDGRWRSLWPEKYSIDDIVKKRDEYKRLGLLHAFDCEYMCEADNPEAHIFQKGDARTVSTTRTWQACYAAYDPARTINTQSAATGVAVFSWVGNRLVVWRGDAKLWLPDQIMEDIFNVADEFSPVEIGVEATGLEEFIMQPLRHMSVQRRQFLPVRRLAPPRGKDTFIRSLQPFFKAREVDFVDVSEEARAQLLSFPRGRKDFPNALAYALLMKPGLPVYDISRDHVQEDPTRIPSAPWYLVVNATTQYTTAVLAQLVDGQVRLYADWVREGSPGENLGDITREARLDAGSRVRIIIPPVSLHDGVGLRVAIRSIQQDLRTGGAVVPGRESLRNLLVARRRGAPLLVCSTAARWTLNALGGGYAHAMGKRGQLEREPVDNYYRVLMEGLESFCAHLIGIERNEEPPRTAVDDTGRPYTTILPTASVSYPTKDAWADQGVTTSPHTIRRTNG